MPRNPLGAWVISSPNSIIFLIMILANASRLAGRGGADLFVLTLLGVDVLLQRLHLLPRRRLIVVLDGPMHVVRRRPEEHEPCGEERDLPSGDVLAQQPHPARVGAARSKLDTCKKAMG